MKDITAKTVGASAVVDPSKRLEQQLTFIDRFDNQYSLYRREGTILHIPRQLATDMLLDMRDEGTPIASKNLFKPRHEDQEKVVTRMNSLLDQGESFIVQAPTGYGKTYVGAEAIAHLNTRTLIITTKEDIIDQWRDAVKNVCGFTDDQIGLWRGDYEPSKQHRVVIGLVQSIAKGPERYPESCFHDFGLTICDEVHRMAAEQFSQAMWWVPSKWRIGLSATPYRKDGRENVFKLHIGPIRVVAKQDVMTPKVIAQPTQWKVPMVHWSGVYKKMPHSPGKLGGLTKAMGKDPARNAIIVQFCRAALKNGRNTIVFSDSIAHLQALYDAFVAEGIPPGKVGFYVGLQNYEGPQKDRKKEREQAKAKPIILATYTMASEATDIPWLDACVLGTPRSDVNQIVGRIRREFENKKMPVVFDLIDTDSKVLKNYWKKRQEWYLSLGAEIVYK